MKCIEPKVEINPKFPLSQIHLVLSEKQYAVFYFIACTDASLTTTAIFLGIGKSAVSQTIRLILYKIDESGTEIAKRNFRLLLKSKKIRATKKSVEKCKNNGTKRHRSSPRRTKFQKIFLQKEQVVGYLNKKKQK